MKSFRKAFGLFAVAGALVVTGTFAPKTVSALLPVEHENRNALFVEHDRKAVIYEHDNKTALIYEHDNKTALIVEHESRNL